MLCHPAGLHIWRWFLELTRTRGRHTVMVAGAMGSQVLHEPAPITYTEIVSWSQVTGCKPNPFETRCLTTMDTWWINASSGGKGQVRRDQGVGEYCQGKDLEECRKQFGDTLPQICSTCPS